MHRWTHGRGGVTPPGLVAAPHDHAVPLEVDPLSSLVDHLLKLGQLLRIARQLLDDFYQGVDVHCVVLRLHGPPNGAEVVHRLFVQPQERADAPMPHADIHKVQDPQEFAEVHTHRVLPGDKSQLPEDLVGIICGPVWPKLSDSPRHLLLSQVSIHLLVGHHERHPDALELLVLPALRQRQVRLLAPAPAPQPRGHKLHQAQKLLKLQLAALVEVVLVNEAHDEALFLGILGLDAAVL
mmetsp:Transcript_69091/g.164614  ORF Transcript_69091/g.164614 Transcript_69091/m.164614 type:complete len:238 (-) Transcript_69091:693-1406(-)